MLADERRGVIYGGMDRVEKLGQQLKAIGDPVRLRILNLLPPEPDCNHAFNVTLLAEQLGMPQPTVSHHLKVLKEADIIRGKKLCRDVIYWINQESADHILRVLPLVFGPLPEPTELKPKRVPKPRTAKASKRKA